MKIDPIQDPDLLEAIFTVRNILYYSGDDMLPIDTTALYVLGARLNRLLTLRNGDKFENVEKSISDPANALLTLIETPPIQLTLCLDAAKELLSSLKPFAYVESGHHYDRQTDSAEEIWYIETGNPENIISDLTIKRITDAYNNFQSVLFAELRKKHIYLVPDRYMYSTDSLLSGSEKNLYEDYILAKLPESTKTNLIAFGKCFALNLPSAASYHVLRGTESLIYDYLKLYNANVKAVEKARDWGAYARLLGATTADPRVVGKIDEIRKLHRNPVIHPRITVTMVHANLLFSSCYGLIPAILADMEKKAKYPDPKILELLPASV